MEILNFDVLPENNKYYGGLSGSKVGVIYNGENWFIKSPKSSRSMEYVEVSYLTSSVSEYLGSHIFQVLGYKVHETLLGMRNNKLTVMCKDFTDRDHRLEEFKSLQNYSNEKIEEYNDNYSEPSSYKGSDLDSILIHFENNPIFVNNPSIEKMFWEMTLIDILINNTDRNSGNWGVLINDRTEEVTSSPIYDNGASFYNKLTKEKCFANFSDEQKCIDNSLASKTSYMKNGKILSMQKLMKMDNKNFEQAILKVVPLFASRVELISELFDELPEDYENIEVLSVGRKNYYLKTMEIRFNRVLLPKYRSLINQNHDKFLEVNEISFF